MGMCDFVNIFRIIQNFMAWKMLPLYSEDNQQINQ